MGAVHVQDLHVRLGGVDILRDLQLEVAEGEFMVLLGPSGCGKSTLLHTIAGLIDVEDGRIQIAGRDITYADPKDRSIGMVFQSYALYPTMTVERNMSFGLRVAGTARAEIARRVAQAAKMLHLAELLQRKPAQLSGGQRQRVAIGRALVRDAGVYLFDEPLSNLDAKLRTELRRELKGLHKAIAKTMVYVTHDQVEAMTLATRIAVMRAGKILQIDTPQRIYEQPANRFVAGFIGSPGMNFVEGSLQRRDGGLNFRSPAFDLDLSRYAFADAAAAQREVGRDGVVLGIRPEHLRIVAADAGDCRARLSLVEPMGAVQVLWLDAAGALLGVELPSEAAAPADGEVGLQLDAHRISLFDAATEQRL
jgi:multiple sugar transport system ATP-binding protein